MATSSAKQSLKQARTDHSTTAGIFPTNMTTSPPKSSLKRARSPCETTVSSHLKFPIPECSPVLSKKQKVSSTDYFFPQAGANEAIIELRSENVPPSRCPFDQQRLFNASPTFFKPSKNDGLTVHVIHGVSMEEMNIILAWLDTDDLHTSNFNVKIRINEDQGRQPSSLKRWRQLASLCFMAEKIECTKFYALIMVELMRLTKIIEKEYTDYIFDDPITSKFTQDLKARIAADSPLRSFLNDLGLLSGRYLRFISEAELTGMLGDELARKTVSISSRKIATIRGMRAPGTLHAWLEVAQTAAKYQLLAQRRCATATSTSSRDELPKEKVCSQSSG